MAFDQNLMKGMVSILVLKVLSEDDMYGYEMIKTLERRSEEAFQINEGALYPILHKLEKEGAVVSYWENGAGNRRRKYYHLTPEGGGLLESKLSEWNDFVRSTALVLE